MHRKMTPDDRQSLAQTCNALAWTLVVRPAGSRDPARALTLARRAVEFDRDQVFFPITLGAALYRAGRYAEGVNILERYLTTRNGLFDAFSLFFLAMARHQVGQHAEARSDFDHALEWRRDNRYPRAKPEAELDAIQAEAQAVLDGPTRELPPSVFATGSANQP
jgi:predicted Zn-dependent protease